MFLRPILSDFFWHAHCSNFVIHVNVTLDLIFIPNKYNLPCESSPASHHSPVVCWDGRIQKRSEACYDI